MKDTNDDSGGAAEGSTEQTSDNDKEDSTSTTPETTTSNYEELVNTYMENLKKSLRLKCINNHTENDKGIYCNSCVVYCICNSYMVSRN